MKPMLYDLHHEIPIGAPAMDVYKAIATEKGLQGWLTPDAVAEPRVGSIAQIQIKIGLRSLRLRMRIDELKPKEKIVWYCLGDEEEWTGTRMIWELSENDGRTVLHLLHAYWHSPGSIFAAANSKWGESIHRLRDYVEGTVPDPTVRNRLSINNAPE